MQPEDLGREEEHERAALLLPWYVTHALEPGEAARFEAHLATCSRCRSDLSIEQRLAAELAALPMDVEQGWARLRRRLEVEDRPAAHEPHPSREPATTARRPRKLRLPALGRRTAWGLAALQAAVLVMVVGVVGFGLHDERTARYRTLSTPRPPTAGNVMVIFRPETREADFRDALEASHARLVDGPTAADAYVLHVADGERSRALTALRENGEVLLAQPIDAPENR